MKLPVILTGLILLMACSKDKHPIVEDPHFQDLTGTWTSVYEGDDERRVIVHPDGKIEVFKSTERGKRMYFDQYLYVPDEYMVDGSDTLILNIILLGKKGKYAGGIGFFKKAGSDSARVSLDYDLYIKDFKIDTAHVGGPKNLFVKN